MKKILILFTLLIVFIPGVKADTITFNYDDLQVYGSSNYYSNYDAIYNSSSKHSEILDTLYSDLMQEYDKYKSEVPYYYIAVSFSVNPNIISGEDLLNAKNYVLSNNAETIFHLYAYSTIPTLTQLADNSTSVRPDYYITNTYRQSDISYNLGIVKLTDAPTLVGVSPFSSFSSDNYYLPLNYFETNFDLINDTSDTYSIKNGETFNPGDVINSYRTADSVNSKYVTVDLSNYYYVLLTLKDYSVTEPFSTLFKVKGMVGFTPIYNYGTISKDDIMGNKVEDRCNLNYEDFTDLRFYILKQDLQNNAIYSAKSCSKTAFIKFDKTIFDVTYVTDDNKNDPVVTINGKDYHTIPFDNLPSSANKNEEENYVPGSSEGFNPIGSLTDSLSKPLDFLKSLLSSFSIFMNFVTSFFNMLPIEFRMISLSTFIIGCVLGLIKIIKS